MFPQRLDRLLESYGLCSERSSASFLRNNLIELNGQKLDFKDKLGSLAQLRKIPVDVETDVLVINGKKMRFFPHQYILLNKPSGYVCSHVSDQSPTVYRLLEKFYESKADEERIYIEENLHSVGRLDKETQGLLLFTTNQFFSHYFTAPQSNVPKTYLVELFKPVDEQTQKLYAEKCALGLFLPAEKKAGPCVTKPSKIVWLEERSCSITVTEGRFHEVRRIFDALGNCVINLKRTAFAGLCLEERLMEGSYRNLSLDEMKSLQSIYVESAKKRGCPKSNECSAH